MTKQNVFNYNLKPWSKKNQIEICAKKGEIAKTFERKFGVADYVSEPYICKVYETFSLETMPTLIIFTLNREIRKNVGYFDLVKLLPATGCRVPQLFYLSNPNPRWNLKNLSRGLNPPKPGLNLVPAYILKHLIQF